MFSKRQYLMKRAGYLVLPSSALVVVGSIFFSALFVSTGCALFEDLDDLRGEDPGISVEVDASWIPTRDGQGEVQPKLIFEMGCEPAGCEFVECGLQHRGDDEPRPRDCAQPFEEEVVLEGQWTFFATAALDGFRETGQAQVEVALDPFEAVWLTNRQDSGSSGARELQLPLVPSGEYGILVDWGDGSAVEITEWDQAETLHVYEESGQYTVTIYGDLYGWSFGETTHANDAIKLEEITNWGSLRLGEEGSHFRGAERFTVSANDRLDLSGTTTLANTFRGCTSLGDIPGIDEWDVSHITDMSSLFRNTDNFDQDISSWDVSSVTDMSSMFRSSSFSRDIGGWNVRSVETMESMFRLNTDFDHDIGGWDVRNVTDMTDMFHSTRLSVDNYDALLIGWESQNVQHGVTFNAGESQFSTEAQGARARLRDDKDWEISDGDLQQENDGDE